MSRAEIQELLRRHGVRAGRRLGQHFLFDAGLLRRIVAAAEVVPGGPVLEVGPGVGVLTRQLLAAGGCVTAVEIDRGLRPPLLDLLAGGEAGASPPQPWLGGLRADDLGPGLRILWADAVRLPWDLLAASDPRPWQLCSNLPYYVTGPFLAAFLRGGLPWTSAVLLVQDEAARRMMAAPGGKTYGAFTCLVGYHAEVERLFSVPRRAFLPPPQVDSVVIRLRRLGVPPTEAPREPLLRVVRAAFGQRRKTLRNALSAGLAADPGLVEAALAAAGLQGQRRAETLTLEEFGRLTLALAGSAGTESEG